MRRFPKYSLILFLAIACFSCEKDDEQEELPTPKIRATLISLNEDGDMISRNWSLPTISATKQNGNITLSANNSQTGEFLSIKVPDNGAEYYTNITNDNDFGYGTWRRTTDAMFWYSNTFPEGTVGDFVLDIDEINQESNTMSGTFFMRVYNPSTGENAFFQNGSFSAIPIVVSDGNDEITENRLSFKVSGVNFNTTSIDVVENENSSELMITATNATSAILMFSLPLSALDSTTFEVGSDINMIGTSYEQPPASPFPGLSGIVVVETHNQGAKTMSGTFDFDVGEFGTPNFTITEGKFELIY